MIRWLRKLLRVAIVLAILGAVLYPITSAQLIRRDNAALLERFGEALEATPETIVEETLNRCRLYSALQPRSILWDVFDEEAEQPTGGVPEPQDVLDPTGTGVIGSVEIPSLGVNLPLYNEVSESTLRAGCARVPGTGYPLAEGNAHAAIAARNEWTNSALFSRLDRLSEGDLFIVDMLGERTTYEVAAMQTVTLTEPLALPRNEDASYCTLVTTSGENRLLVRGHATQGRLTADNDDITVMQDSTAWVFFALPVLAILALIPLPFELIRRLFQSLKIHRIRVGKVFKGRVIKPAKRKKT